MAQSRAVDDEREEHRMLIRLNDFNPTLASLLIGEEHGKIKNEQGILRQKVHDKPYTITLYAILKDYGMTPISRIKPRVRFSRQSYDEVASGSPMRFPIDATVDFVEFKHGIENDEQNFEQNGKKQEKLLQQIFFDALANKDVKEDPAVLLNSQHDTFLMKPPVKMKSKITSFESSSGGVPIGEFLDALNKPRSAAKIFSKYKGGKTFVKDLRSALEPFSGLDFKFGIYSRYRRWDCVYGDFINQQAQPYRTTFDPFTVLGFIKSQTGAAHLQPLVNERYARWEHKINPSIIDPKSLNTIAAHIKKIRSRYLIPRCLSKSQTALTMLKEWTESHLSLMEDIGYHVTMELPLKSKKFSDIKERKKLRAVFNGHDEFPLHSQNEDIVENHKNIAIGERDGLEYMLDSGSFAVRQKSKKIHLNNSTLIIQPHYNKELITSADELRSKVPIKGFDKCYSVDTDECGYTILSKKTGRAYTVSYGRRVQGSVTYDKIKSDDPKNYLSIRHLGITPERFQGMKISRPGESYSIMEEEIVKEMKNIAKYLKHKDVI